MKIKKLTSIILAAMMTATAVPFNEVSVPYYSFPSYAVDAEANEIVAEGTCGENLTWTLNNNGNMYIAGEGAMDNWTSADDVPWAEYADQIKTVNGSKELKTIGDYAFYGCENIENAFLTTVIGKHAYEGCKKIYGYSYYSDNEVVEIKDYAFYGCEKFKSITIKNPLCLIADSEFVFPEDFEIECYENSSAHEYAVKYGREFELITDKAPVYPENPYVPEESETPDDNNSSENDEQGIAAEGTLGENIAWTLYDSGQLSISGSGAIMGSDGSNPWGEYTDDITSVVLEHGITEIGDYAFYGCENLIFVSLEYKGGLDRIGFYAFDGCSRLMDLEIGGHIGKIGDFAFNGCEMLDKITITNSDCSIVDSEFVFPENTVIEGFAGSTAEIYSNNYNREFASLGVITPDSGVQAVVAEGKCGENIKWTLDDNGSLVFSGEGDMDNWASAEDTPWAEYTSLIRTVSMSEEITSIGDYAFYGCENLLTGVLTSVIGAHAYEGCKRMNGYSYYGDVSPINEIKDCAFKGCYSLWAIPIANPDCIIADSENVFDNNTAIEGYVGSTAHKYAEKYERDFQNITLIDIEGSCGESLYWYMTSDGMLGINGSGKMDNYSENITAAPWYSYVKDITSICINDFTSDDDAIELSENCFAMCENAETIHFYNSGCIIADSAETIPENAVILGYEGSTAQKYAEKYNRKFNAIPTTDATGTLNEEFTWELNSEGILYITGFGAMDDYTDSNPWGEYADKITSVYFYGNVTSIGKNAFSHCKNLEFVDIDESIEFIDMDAFSGCNKLDYLNFHGNKKCVIYDNASTIPAHTELIGHFGSPLHEYADTYERSFYWIDGDINEDSSVDASDASMVLDEYSNIQTGGKAKLSSIETTTADVTNDNVVDAADSSAILQYYAKASTGQNPTWD